MNDYMCEKLLKQVPYYWSRKGEERSFFCQMKGCPCEGSSCRAWMSLEDFCLSLCPRHESCFMREAGLPCALGQGPEAFDEYGFCLVHLRERLQNWRPRGIRRAKVRGGSSRAGRGGREAKA